MLDVLNFSIPGKPEYIQMLRLAIGSIAGKSGFDVEKIEDIKVAVAEACKPLPVTDATAFRQNMN